MQRYSSIVTLISSRKSRRHRHFRAASYGCCCRSCRGRRAGKSAIAVAGNVGDPAASAVNVEADSMLRKKSPCQRNPMAVSSVQYSVEHGNPSLAEGKLQPVPWFGQLHLHQEDHEVLMRFNHGILWTACAILAVVRPLAEASGQHNGPVRPNPNIMRAQFVGQSPGDGSRGPRATRRRIPARRLAPIEKTPGSR